MKISALRALPKNTYRQGIIMLKKLLMTVILVTPLVSLTHAADMRIEMSEPLSDGSRAPGIHITGDIVRGDYAKFKRIADRLPDGIALLVLLQSAFMVQVMKMVNHLLLVMHSRALIWLSLDPVIR